MKTYILIYDGCPATKVFPHEIALLGQHGLISGNQKGLEFVLSPNGELTTAQKKAIQSLGLGYELLTPTAGRVQ